MATGLLLTTVIGPKSEQPLAAALAEQNAFKATVKEMQSGNPDKMPELTPPHLAIFHSFVEALFALDVGGGPRKQIGEWLKAIQDDPQSGPQLIQEVCQTFQVYQVKSNADMIRLQFAMQSGPIRTAVMSAMRNIEVGRICTGPPPRSFLEEELADWMGALDLSE